jgi:Flp pilus assembly pilin Flp
MEFMRDKREGSAKRERGATMVEYALLVALLCLVAIGGVRAVGASVKTALDQGAQPLLGSAGILPQSSGGGAVPQPM